MICLNIFHLIIWPQWKELHACEAVISVNKTEKNEKPRDCFFSSSPCTFQPNQCHRKRDYSFTPHTDQAAQFTSWILAWIQRIHTGSITRVIFHQ